MRGIGRAVASVVFLVLTTAACNGSDDAAGTTTTSPVASTTSTTAVDVTTIPATIDMVYVQRVFDVLDEIRGEVVKELLAKRQLTGDMADRLGAVYNPEELQDQAAVLPELLKTDENLYMRPPGSRRTVVQRLLTARPDCVLAEVKFDVSAVVVNPPPPIPSYIRLAPKGSASPITVNPTQFLIADQDTKPSEPCAVP